PALFRGHFQIINLWCPISHPAKDWPLILSCDYKAESYGVRYHPKHRWVYKTTVDPDAI
ncbi:hypothetical protein J3A83DRAFT_4082448, partial [Scleroderma citrinum]